MKANCTYPKKTFRLGILLILLLGSFFFLVGSYFPPFSERETADKEIFSKKLLSLLERNLYEGDFETRWETVKVLRGMRKHKGIVISILKKALGKYTGVEDNILEAIADLDQEEGKFMDFIASFFQNSDPEIRGAAVSAFSKYGSQAIKQKKSITLLLQDENSFVRCLSVRTMRKISCPDSVDVLSQLLEEDGSREVRAEVAYALSRIPRTKKQTDLILNSLMKTVQEDSGAPVYNAIESLGKISPQAEIAAPLLIWCLRFSEMRPFARDALLRLGNKSSKTVFALTHALKNGKKEEQIAIIEIISNLGRKADFALPSLVMLLEKDHLQKYIGKALVKIGGKKRTQELMLFFPKCSEDTQITIIEIIVKCGQDAELVTEELLPYLHASSVPLRSKVTWALGKILKQ